MKRLFLLLVMGLTLTAPCAFADDDEEIPQTPPPSDEGGSNNGNNSGSGNNSGGIVTTPVFIPIGAPTELPTPGGRSLSPIYGQYFAGSVELYFAADLGSVAVSVFSVTTGDMWVGYGDSYEGFVSISIDAKAGEYSVTIETQNAGVFIGAFRL